jgi:predicted ATPase
MEECRGRIERALAVLKAGPNHDTRREMKLYAALGASLLYIIGHVPEIGTACRKALELATSLDDTRYQLHSLWGLYYFHAMSGRNDLALVMAQKFCGLAAGSAGPNVRLTGERMIGVTKHFLGEQPSARRHFERVLANYRASEHNADMIPFEIDQRVAARVFLSRVLWLQGFPEQAMRAAESSIEDARAANHAISLCFALAYAAGTIAFWVADLAAAEHYVGMLLDHSTRHALPLWRAWGLSQQGVLEIKRGDVATGLELLGAGFDELGEARAALGYVIFRGALASGLGRAGQIADGIAAIEEALAWTERTEQRWIIAEFLRIKGELLLLEGAPAAAATAEDHFRQALGWARRQGALSWELRTAMSLARLLRDQSRAADAVALLQPVYDRFTEGFDTADVKAAKALLDTFQ